VSTTTFLRPGETVGGFRIVDLLGVGGMAIVYRAEQVSLYRPVALKVLSSKLSGDSAFRERFRREGMHAAALEHPNIVPIYDSGEEDGHLYIAMRLIEGTSLAELIQDRGVTADQAVEVLKPVAGALDAAHAAGLIHRDVKPQNILVTSQGHPYLADFGIAKGSDTVGLTATGGFLGSANYASPEQIRGLTLTLASDVYALTAVLYQCLTGEVPYFRETDAGIMHAHLHEPPPTLPAVDGADSEFHTVLARGMAKDPGSRYSHAGDLMNAAALCVRRLPVEVRRSVPAFPPVVTLEDVASAKGPLAYESKQQARRGDTELVAPEQLERERAGQTPTSADLRRPQPSAPASGEDGRRRRRLPALPALAVLAAVIAGAIALTAGRTPEDGSRSYRAGSVAVVLPSSFRTATKVSPPPGMALVPGGALSDGRIDVYIGRLSTGAVAAELPAVVRSDYGPPTRTSTVPVAGGLARSFQWSDAGTLRRVMLIAATRNGELGITCGVSSSSGVTSSAGMRVCASLAAHVGVLDTTVEYPGADPRIGAAVKTALSMRSDLAPRGLNDHRLSGRSAGLSQIAAVDGHAAATLSAVTRPGRYDKRLATLSAALSREGALAVELARAATHDRRMEYAERRNAFGLASVELVRESRALRATGLTVPRITQITLAPVPRGLRPRTVSTLVPAPAKGSSGPEATNPVEAPQPSPEIPTPAPKKAAAPKPAREEEFVTEAK
jgi:serine/threonine protein kinase